MRASHAINNIYKLISFKKNNDSKHSLDYQSGVLDPNPVAAWWPIAIVVTERWNTRTV